MSSNILRKLRQQQQQQSDELEELLVFGYACRVYTSDDVEQPKLIPWHGDESLTMDRFDCRLHLFDLRSFDADNVKTTSAQNDIDETEKVEEEMCDEERYLDLRQAEQKEIDDAAAAATTKQRAAIPFHYGVQSGSSSNETVTESEEEPIPYTPRPELKVPVGVDIPSSEQENAVIEKTATFVAAQGTQMEIVIKAKQRDSDKFAFLDWDHKYNTYYRHVLKMIKTNRYKPLIHEAKPKVKKYRKKRRDGVVRSDNGDKKVKVEVVKDDSDSDTSSGDGYLHPSLMCGGGVKQKSGTSTPIARYDSPKIPTTEYKLGQENDVYSAIFTNIQAIHHAKDRERELELQQRRDKELDIKGDDEMAEIVSVTAASHKPVGPPPSDYKEWHQWFYGREASSDPPTVTPAPPDLTIVINKTAEFVQRFGPGAEDHLRGRTEMQLDFLNRTHTHYSFYQLRLRWMQYDAHFRQQAAANLPPPPQAATTSFTPVVPNNLHHSQSTPVIHSRPPPTPLGSFRARQHNNEPQYLATKPDNVKVVHSGGDGNMPLITTMTNDEHRSSPHIIPPPPPPLPCTTSSQPSNSAADVQRQAERKQKAQMFLANILAEKKQKREAEERAMKDAIEKERLIREANAVPLVYTVENRPESMRRRSNSRHSSSSSSGSDNDRRRRRRKRSRDERSKSRSPNRRRRRSRS